MDAVVGPMDFWFKAVLSAFALGAAVWFVWECRVFCGILALMLAAIFGLCAWQVSFTAFGECAGFEYGIRFPYPVRTFLGAGVLPRSGIADVCRRKHFIECRHGAHDIGHALWV